MRSNREQFGRKWHCRKARQLTNEIWKSLHFLAGYTALRFLHLFLLNLREISTSESILNMRKGRQVHWHFTWSNSGSTHLRTTGFSVSGSLGNSSIHVRCRWLSMPCPMAERDSSTTGILLGLPSNISPAFFEPALSRSPFSCGHLSKDFTSWTLSTGVRHWMVNLQVLSAKFSVLQQEPEEW